MVEVKLDPSGSFITLVDQSGTSLRFHTVWLRDNAPEPSTISPTNGQRLITIDQIPADISITNARIHDGTLVVDFSTGLRSVAYPSLGFMPMPMTEPPPHNVAGQQRT